MRLFTHIFERPLIQDQISLRKKTVWRKNLCFDFICPIILNFILFGWEKRIIDFLHIIWYYNVLFDFLSLIFESRTSKKHFQNKNVNVWQLLILNVIKLLTLNVRVFLILNLAPLVHDNTNKRWNKMELMQ